MRAIIERLVEIQANVFEQLTMTDVESILKKIRANTSERLNMTDVEPTNQPIKQSTLLTNFLNVSLCVNMVRILGNLARLLINDEKKNPESREIIMVSRCFRAYRSL